MPRWMMHQKSRVKWRTIWMIPLLFAVLPLRAQERPLLPAELTRPPIVAMKRPIPQAVGITLTPRGEKYLIKNLERLLGNLGLSFRDVGWDELKHKTEQPISIEELARKYPESGQTLVFTRDLLQKLFAGLTINDPQPMVVLQQPGFHLSFKKFALMTDREQLQALGKKSGAVFVLDLEIDELDAGSDTLLVKDTNNQFLKVFGFKAPLVQMLPGSPTLQIHVPFYLDIGPKGQMIVESLPMSSNFAQTKLGFKYESIVAPRVAVMIDEARFEVTPQNMAKIFDEHKPRLLESLKTMIDSMAAQSLPALINEYVSRGVPQRMEQINFMPPPGRPTETNDPKSKDPDLIWGLVSQKISLKENLQFDFAAYVEDSMTRTSAPIDTNANARGPVALATVTNANYDLALTVNRGLVNRMLQLAFNRGYFEKLDTGDGKPMKLAAPPSIDAPKAAADLAPSRNPRLRLTIAVEQATEGFGEHLALGNKIIVWFDVIARLTNQPGKAGMFVTLESIDLDSARIPDENFTLVGKLFKGKVMKTVRARLTETSNGWKTIPAVLPGELPLPPQSFGLPLDISTLKMDKNGYLVMYLNFGGNR